MLLVYLFILRFITFLSIRFPGEFMSYVIDSLYTFNPCGKKSNTSETDLIKNIYINHN